MECFKCGRKLKPGDGAYRTYTDGRYVCIACNGHTAGRIRQDEIETEPPKSPPKAPN